MSERTPRFADGLIAAYADVLTPEAIAALAVLSPLNVERKTLIEARFRRRRDRANMRHRLTFLEPEVTIPRTSIRVGDARAGNFDGSDIPDDLQRQWIQGTGPAARPRSSVRKNLRSVAYALLSGADGWMFDGEDALGQVATLALDNQRSLRLAFSHDAIFLAVAEEIAAEMNGWGRDFLGREIISDWRQQLSFTTRLFRPRGLHLDDRHIHTADGEPFAASIVDSVLYIVNNHRALRGSASSIVLYLPKIQTAEEAALWHELLAALEEHLSLPSNAIKTYVLVEQLEAAFQLMEIRAALGQRFVGFNTGRWDYINSVADAMAWDDGFCHPNIEEIAMTFGYMRHYEDRVRRAVNTPDRNGRCALWQSGMEPNIPVGSQAGVTAAMQRAVAAAEREQREGASGKWVAHWKMVHIVRPVWEKFGQANQLARRCPRLTYDQRDLEGLLRLDVAPRTALSARRMVSIALQYCNAFGQGLQAVALKPADCFADDDVLYLMEDMATGEIRLSILWEWVHKHALLSLDGEPIALTSEWLLRLISDEYHKLLSAPPRHVHEPSKSTTLPIAREVVTAYVMNPVKAPWLIELLNLTLDEHNLDEVRRRIAVHVAGTQADSPGDRPIAS